MTGGVQRYKCGNCGRRYSLDRRPREYAANIRERAVQMRSTGASIRKIAQELAVSPQTVGNWIRTIPSSSTTAPTVETTSERPNNPRITIADVARHAGVSTSTISNYLNDKGRMSPETRQRISEAMTALYFTPNALTRAIRRRRTHTLGFLSYGIYEFQPDVGLNLVAPVLGAINRAANQSANDVHLYTGWPERARSRTGSDFLNGQIDGLLWMSPQKEHHAQLRFAANGGLPIVSLMSRRVPSAAGFVVSDNIGAIREVVRHLVDRGHDRIAFLGATQLSDFVDRVVGYREGLEICGKRYDPAIEALDVPIAEWSLVGVAPIVDRLMAVPNPPTAIVAVDDNLARFSIERLRERGFRVPDDVAVTGFDDTTAEYAAGGITTLRQNLSEIGKIGVECLVRMIQGVPASECQVLVPVTLIPRSST